MNMKAKKPARSKLGLVLSAIFLTMIIAALGVISILPFICEYFFAMFGLNVSNLAIGGTGLLIVVSVALESLRQLNSRALMVTYDEYEG
jgi:preprotein translocase subunit SecY